MSAERPDNPYVGPRALRTGERLYGRDREVSRLFDLLLAERIVLLYSPSGAGKSSLLQAGLLPRLRAEGFAIRPVVRVGMAAPGGAPPGVNRHVLSTLLSLEEDVPEARQQPLAALAGSTLAEYLRRRTDDDAHEGEVIVLDQFEELLTVDPAAIAAKHAFFRQLGEALRDDRVWLVVAMREDFIAGLDPYRAAIPGKLRATFRLDLLDRSAALTAVQAPALAAGVTFSDDAAARLVDDLRTIRVQRLDGGVDTSPGPHVEPVQLQVVCRELWAALPGDATVIGVEHLEMLGDVDHALARYYDAAVAAAANSSATPERALRAWIARHLVTPQGLRTQVLLTPTTTHGLASAALTALVDAHLLRSDTRRGMTWLELAHDRIVAPLLASNATWTATRMSPMQRQAELWHARGRPESLLLASAAEAASQLASADDRTPDEQAFLAESVTVRRREAAAARNLRLLRLTAAALAALLVVALVYALVSARARAERALAEQRAAEAALIRQLVAQVALRRDQQPELAALLAVAAARRLTDEWQRKSALLSAAVTQPQLRTRVLPTAAAYTKIAALAGDLLALERGGQVVRVDLTDRSATPLLPPGIHADDFAAHPNKPMLAISRGPAIELWELGAAAASATIELPADPPSLGPAPPPDLPTWIAALRFSADGSKLAAVRVRGSTARGLVIDVAARTAIILHGTLPAAGSELELSPDGEVALVGMLAPDGRIKVYEHSPGATATPAPSHAGLGRTYLVRHDPYRPRLLTGGEGRTATLWTTRGGVPVPAPPPSQQPPADSAAAQPGDPTPLQLLDDGDMIDAMFLPDGALVVLTETWISMWRGEPLAPWGTPIPAPTRRMSGLAPVGPDGAWIAAASASDGPLLVFDPQRLAPLRLRPPAAPTSLGGDTEFHAVAPRVALDPAARRLLVTDFDGEHARLTIHATTGGPEIAGAQAGDQQFAAVSLADERALFVDVTGALRSWRPGGEVTTLWRLATRPRRVALIDAGQAVVAAADAADANRVTLAREADGFATTTIDAGAKISAIALDRTGERLAVATCSEPRSQATCARSELRVHPRGGPAGPARTIDSAVRGLVFAADGARLASVQTDQPPAVWDLATGQRIALTVRRVPGQFIAADFSADGQVLLASAESAHAAVLLTLWDLRTGEELAPPLTAHHLAVGAFAEDQPRTVLLAGDGGLVVSSSFDGVLLWDIDNAALERRACTLAGRALSDDEWAWFLGPGTPREALCPQHL